MIGAKNVIFGFFFLAFTAALGPYMIVKLMPDTEKAAQQRQKAMAELQVLASNDFERDLEPVSAETLGRLNTRGLLALNRFLQQRALVDAVKAGPHAHGNLEALLNIAVGVVLAFLALPAWFKQVISWCFLLGALFHAGMLYLSVVFGLGWAGTLLGTGIGPVLILLGLVLAGVGAAWGWRPRQGSM